MINDDYISFVLNTHSIYLKFISLLNMDDGMSCICCGIELSKTLKLYDIVHFVLNIQFIIIWGFCSKSSLADNQVDSSPPAFHLQLVSSESNTAAVMGGVPGLRRRFILLSTLN